MAALLAVSALQVFPVVAVVLEGSSSGSSSSSHWQSPFLGSDGVDDDQLLVIKLDLGVVVGAQTFIFFWDRGDGSNCPRFSLAITVDNLKLMGNVKAVVDTGLA